MSFFRRIPALGVALLLFSCGADENQAPATTASSLASRPFWTVRDFTPDIYDQRDMLVLIYDQPDEDKPIILTLIRQLVKESLAGVETADELSQIQHMAWYVHTHFAAVSIRPFTLRSALEYRQAECAASSTIFQMMVRSLGYPTRSTGFFGVPIQASHTAAEVLIDNEWRYVDPSFGVFFTADGLLSGAPLSMDTLLTYRYFVAPNAFYPISSGRLGWHERTPKPNDLEQLFSPTQTDLLSSGNYRLFLNETQVGIPYDLGYEMVSEYTFDLSATPQFDIGTDNGEGSDIALHLNAAGTTYDATQLYFAGDYTGTYGPVVNSHAYTITGLQPGQKVRFRAGLVYGDPADINLTVRKGKLETFEVSPSGITAVFTSLRREMEVGITVTDEKRILFDSLHFQR